ncbi:hypothetical protein RUM43_011106 [Polyplax serrata]|uniref:Uncharacterized protein n=1 Tax=Polyplax serrata TaxID=468196 RepID=A0AAN8NXX2_POLSC
MDLPEGRYHPLETGVLLVYRPRRAVSKGGKQRWYGGNTCLGYDCMIMRNFACLTASLGLKGCQEVVKKR